MASEFKEKINNVFGHLAGKGGVVTDDSLRRLVCIEFHEMSPHLTLQQMLVRAIFPNNEDRIQFSLQLLSDMFFTQFDV